MYAFEIERPTSIADAVKALAADEAQPLGGGQTLIPTLKQRLAMPSVLISLAGINEMRGICTDDTGRLCIGGSTRHDEVAAGAFAGLAGMAGKIGDPAVRNRGTLGGSLTDKREIAADDFFLGMFETALDEGEIITQVKFPVPSKSAYAKFEQPASRFALVGVFVAQLVDGVRVAVTGASESGVFRWSEAEAALSGNFNVDALSGLSVAADGMIGDLHGTPAYRAHLVGVMSRRAVAAAR